MNIKFLDINMISNTYLENLMDINNDTKDIKNEKKNK